MIESLMTHRRIHALEQSRKETFLQWQPTINMSLCIKEGEIQTETTRVCVVKERKQEVLVELERAVVLLKQLEHAVQKQGKIWCLLVDSNGFGISLEDGRKEKGRRRRRRKV